MLTYTTMAACTGFGYVEQEIKVEDLDSDRNLYLNIGDGGICSLL